MSNRMSFVVSRSALWLSASLLACANDERTRASSTIDDATGNPVPSDVPSGEPDPNPMLPSGSGEPPTASEGTDGDLPLAPIDPDGAGGTPSLPGGEDDRAPGEPVQQALPALPSVRQEHAVVALDGEIYVVGGFTPQVTSTMEAFDPASNTWRSAAEVPYPLHHANAAAIDGRLYIAGFYAGASFTLVNGRVLEYDPAQDAWSERGLMPEGTERASACVATLGTSIYLFGGARLGDSVTDASVYDVASDTWTELPPLPEPREHCVAAQIDGTLFVAAGRSGGIGGFQPNTWAFDPALFTYTERAPIPTPRGGVAGAVLDGKLHIFGGEGNAADPSG
ncbi:MAG TPA: kelch repeat-containing protein, partial [Polyangiaceae bacterium]|nr:kelch repeat-containing protein [Polyangiaceae bacterium]